MGIIILSSVGESCSEPRLSARQSIRRGHSQCIPNASMFSRVSPNEAASGSDVLPRVRDGPGQRRTAPTTSKDAGERNACPQRCGGDIVLVRPHDAQGVAGAYPAESHAERVASCPTACPEESFHPRSQHSPLHPETTPRLGLTEPALLAAEKAIPRSEAGRAAGVAGRKGLLDSGRASFRGFPARRSYRLLDRRPDGFW